MEKVPTNDQRPVASGMLPRSCLVVPASDARKVSKALGTSADEVVLDLEDAVAPSAKEAARGAVVEILRAAPATRLAVRVNQIGTPWCHRDVLDVVAAALPAARVTVVVPKVDSAADVAFVDRLVRGALAERGTESADVRIDVLVESAAALRDLHAIAGASELMRAIVVGYADLGADLGRDAGDDPGVWDTVRHDVVVAARATGRAVIDGPWLGVAADESFVRDRARARAFGFDGTWVIHPAQVAEATRIFSPSVGEVDWARRVVEMLEQAVSSGSGAVAMHGQMIDEAVAVRARSVLARSLARPARSAGAS